MSLYRVEIGVEEKGCRRALIALSFRYNNNIPIVHTCINRHPPTLNPFFLLFSQRADECTSSVKHIGDERKSLGPVAAQL